MNLLDTLTRAADEEQLRLHPLPEHAAAAQEEHMRRHYALLLAAVLTSQPTISESQTRLLRLLLDALKLGDIRGSLFEQARELAPESLIEAARLIREAGFAQHLVLDTLVLLRLDAPLNDETARLVGELAAFLNIDEIDLAIRAQDASAILGLQASNTAPTAAKGKTKDEETIERSLKSPSMMAEHWPQRLSHPLTSEALRNGLQGGLWVLDANLDIDFPWQATDAFFIFRCNAVLNTFAKEGAIQITNCHMIDAVMDFQGACSITVENCNWQGDYDPAARRTALNSQGQALTVNDCQFATHNARAIAVQNNGLVLTGSQFSHCGHEGLDGGAVWHSDNQRRISNCYFDHCLAARGGALYCISLYEVTQCEFIACESKLLQEKMAGDVAIYAQQNDRNPVLTTSVFRQTSINVGDSYAGKGRQIAVNCQFIDGNLYYRRSDGHIFAQNCTFDDGGVIELVI